MPHAGFEWVSTIASLVAGVGGVAAIVLALKSIKLTEKSMAASQATQTKIDGILEDDRRYKEFVDKYIAQGLERIKKSSIGGTRRYVPIDETENARYLARAVREGLFEPYSSGNYWVTK